MNPSGLTVEYLTRRYGQTEAVRDVSLTISPGEIHCLLGASGSGKSTLLRIIAGLERQCSGVVRIGEEVVSDGRVHQLAERRAVGLVFQDFALFPHLNALQNVLFGMPKRRSSESIKKAQNLLVDVGLGDRIAAMPHTMSGGEQQRVALARAMARTPQIMLLDEPFSGLDVQLRTDVRETTLRLLRSAGIATLLVTHDPSEAISCADRISVMQVGRITQTATPSEVYREPVDSQTAEIFGMVNRLPVRREEGRAMTPLGVWASPLADDATEVLCRPEQLRLRPASAEKSEREFEVKGVSLEGATLVYLLKAQDGLELTARTLASEIIETDRVHVSLRTHLDSCPPKQRLC